MGDSARRAMRYALRLISIKGRSEGEVRDRLKRKGFNTDTIAAAVSELKEYNYIDDRALAGSLLYHSVQRKHLGKRGIRSFLIKRGIPEDIIDSMGIDSIDEFEGAMRLAERRLHLYRDLPERKARMRIMGLLQRRGHSGETVRSVINNIFSSNR